MLQMWLNWSMLRNIIVGYVLTRLFFWWALFGIV